ncbi:MAG: lipoyl(octanoyl) transferase LipB [bacterium]|nr:lipoyl(octanoyl) transferase LipB [bacterium]
MELNQKNNALLLISNELIPYDKAYEKQKQLVELRKSQEIPDFVWLLQHPPVYTIGRSNESSIRNTKQIPNLLWDKSTLEKYGIQLYYTDRGGDITYHGPGQIVGYFIVDLNLRQNDIHQFFRDLEEAIIQTISHWKIQGVRLKGKTGVWVNGEKICAMGIRVSRWITLHGFALNINPNLYHFQGIIPCGIQSAPVTSLSKILQEKVEINHVIPILINALEQIFQWEFTQVEKIETILSIHNEQVIFRN